MRAVNPSSSSLRKQGSRFLTRWLFWIPAFAGMTIMAVSVPAAAEEPPKAETPAASPEKPSFEYSPDFCEFSVKFPEEPYKTKRCDGGKDKKCYEMISYTQVYMMEATVNFRAVCNPLDKGIYEQYSPEVMAKTIKAMTTDSVIETYNSDFSEDEQKRFKQAGLVGQGMVGRTPAIYIAQMWLGKQSAMTIEAELIGEANEEADKLYSDILKTIKYSGIKPKTEDKD